MCNFRKGLIIINNYLPAVFPLPVTLSLWFLSLSHHNLAGGLGAVDEIG